ncbi:MerR family transcriptional regulator, partial [Cupriavidus necator]
MHLALIVDEPSQFRTTLSAELCAELGAELAQMPGVAVITLRRWHKAGKLVPACRTIGGHRRYDAMKVREVMGMTTSFITVYG